MESLYIALLHAKFMLSVSTDWQTTAKWLANGFIAVSAMVVSFSPEWAGYSIAFVGFLLGHIIWAMSAWSMKDVALIMLNVGFIPVDLYAMYTRL